MSDALPQGYGRIIRMAQLNFRARYQHTWQLPYPPPRLDLGIQGTRQHQEDFDLGEAAPGLTFGMRVSSGFKARGPWLY